MDPSYTMQQCQILAVRTVDLLEIVYPSEAKEIRPVRLTIHAPIIQTATSMLSSQRRL